MIEVTVRTQWQGKVAVRGHVLLSALERQEGIAIYHDHAIMTVPYAELSRRMVGESEQTFRDRFRKYPRERLYYFYWKPNVTQAKMLEV